MIRLRKGDIIRYQKQLWRVTMVNTARAVIEPLEKKRVKIVPTVEGEEGTEFESAGRAVSISVASDVPIVGRDV